MHKLVVSRIEKSKMDQKALGVSGALKYCRVVLYGKVCPWRVAIHPQDRTMTSKVVLLWFLGAAESAVPKVRIMKREAISHTAKPPAPDQCWAVSVRRNGKTPRRHHTHLEVYELKEP